MFGGRVRIFVLSEIQGNLELLLAEGRGLAVALPQSIAGFPVVVSALLFCTLLF